MVSKHEMRLAGGSGTYHLVLNLLVEQSQPGLLYFGDLCASYRCNYEAGSKYLVFWHGSSMVQAGSQAAWQHFLIAS